MCFRNIYREIVYVYIVRSKFIIIPSYSTNIRLLEELNLPMLAFPQYQAAATGIVQDEKGGMQSAAAEEPVKLS